MITTINPATEEILAYYEEFNDDVLDQKLAIASKASDAWRKTSLDERAKLMHKLSEILRSKKDDFAKIITLEMGKPIAQSRDEVEKCAMTAEYYSKNIDVILQSEIYPTKFSQSYVTFEPIGIILAVMPWNFPFWQALRAAIPTILAGNVLVLKHASSVQGSAEAIQSLFEEAGFPEGVFTNLVISSSRVEKVIRDPRIQAITLTGSEEVGAKVAAIASSEIKKTVMELGGSDPFIVLKDANVEFTCENAKNARLRNGGQTCTSAKRFIVVRDIIEEFTDRVIRLFEQTKVGDPNSEDTEVGPLASLSALQTIQKQVDESIKQGAVLEFGGKRLDQKGFYFSPTVLSGVKKGMLAYEEEIFGPVATIIVAENDEEAIQIANDNRYGLAASLWTGDLEKAKALIPQIQAGSVFVNTSVTSIPNMPFGGVKKSGYGRELSEYGIKEFLNIKSVVIK